MRSRRQMVRTPPSNIAQVERPSPWNGQPAGLQRSALSQLCLFAGLTGLTTMLLLASWTSRPSAQVLGEGVLVRLMSVALLAVAAVFGVARVWPERSGPGQRSPEG
jgi:hypothetical protein